MVKSKSEIWKQVVVAFLGFLGAVAGAFFGGM